MQGGVEYIIVSQYVKLVAARARDSIGLVLKSRHPTDVALHRQPSQFSFKYII